MASPELWAHGPGGRGCGGGGCRGGGGWHGGCGWRGGGCRGGGLVIASGGGYGAPFWGGYGGYGYWGGGWGGYGAACAPYGACASYPYAAMAPQPSYYVNYSPYIPTGVAPAPVAPVAVAPVAESTGCALVSGDLIGNVQRALRQRGFYNRCIDGVSGPPTRAAIRAYAASCGWTSSGIIDAQLLKSLGIM